MTEKATFAGGCFWCMQPPFDSLNGVVKTVPGYAGGSLANPSYEQVCTGSTGHTEVVQITYDPNLISYTELLDVFWRQIDPTMLNGQFADRGNQYRTAIFYHNQEQKTLAEKSKTTLAESGIFDAPIMTEITELNNFFPAEEYHRDYYKKNSEHYKLYRRGSGREAFLKAKWDSEN